MTTDLQPFAMIAAALAVVCLFGWMIRDDEPTTTARPRPRPVPFAAEWCRLVTETPAG